MTTYWCELAWLGGDRVDEGVTLEVDGDRIVTVGRGVASAPAGSMRLAGVTIPGLANAHSHAFHRALRGNAQSGRSSFWTWREHMYTLAERLDPDSYLALARATFAEMVLAGITLVGEFHYLHHSRDGTPYSEPNAMGVAMLAAAAEAGLRITLLDACYLHGGLTAAGANVPLAGVQRRFGDGDAEAWWARALGLGPYTGATARVSGAIHSLRAVDPGAAATIAALVGSHGAPVHAHVSEQPAENEWCLAAYGRTPTAVLADAGAVNGRFTAVHAIHLTDTDIARLGGAGATCCLCPTTERDLADGVAPGRRLRDAGAPLALGSDSHAVIDLFEEARSVELDERLVSGVRGHHSASDLLTAACAGGYASLGWSEGGRIAPDALADFTTVSLDGVRLAGTAVADVLEAVVFAASAADVRTVVVGGRLIVSEGRHLTVDVGRELHDAITAVRS